MMILGPITRYQLHRPCSCSWQWCRRDGWPLHRKHRRCNQRRRWRPAVRTCCTQPWCWETGNDSRLCPSESGNVSRLKPSKSGNGSRLKPPKSGNERICFLWKQICPLPLLQGRNLETLPVSRGLNLEPLPLSEGHNLESLPVSWEQVEWSFLKFSLSLQKLKVH